MMATQIKGMATVVEKTQEGTIYRCPESYSIPNLDMLTLLFGTNPRLLCRSDVTKQNQR